ncbi:MAG: AAA family ATPase [Polyangiales bacterium]
MLDASFRSPKMRAAARELSRAHGVPFHFIECHAPPEVCKAWLRHREQQGGAVSDGRLAIFDDFLKEWEPVRELPADEHLLVDTSRPEEQTHAEVTARVATWPAGLRG